MAAVARPHALETVAAAEGSDFLYLAEEDRSGEDGTRAFRASAQPGRQTEVRAVVRGARGSRACTAERALRAESSQPSGTRVALQRR